MLECQRNGESSFAVSASTCIHSGKGAKGRKGSARASERKIRMCSEGRKAVKKRERNEQVCTRAHRACVCSDAVCRAHSRDLQLMKLGCSRVACQINMSPAPPPPSTTTTGLRSQTLPYAHLSLLAALLPGSSSSSFRFKPSARSNTLTLSRSPPFASLDFNVAVFPTRVFPSDGNGSIRNRESPFHSFRTCS